MDTTPWPAVIKAALRAEKPAAQPCTPAAYATLAYLAAEVSYLAQRGQLARIDAAAELRARGETPPSGSTVAGIRRKAAAMLRHCPPAMLPHPPAPRRTGLTGIDL